MKKIFFTFLSLMIVTATFAQVDRSKQPEPGPAPSIDFGKYKLYELKNGLKVIVVKADKLPRVTMNLVVDRDPIFEADKAGFVSLAGEMLRQGTKNREKSVLDEEVDFMGASLGTSSSNVFASGLSKYSEKLIELMSDVVLNPAFPQAEFDKLKKQTISGIESSKDDPQGVGATVFNAVLYGKTHPYGESATVETAESVQLSDCIDYYNQYWMPNNAYLVIVGDIKPSKAKKLAKKYFGSWEMGTKPVNTFEKPAQPAATRIAFVNKESAVQSVLNIGNTIDLKPGDPDVVKLDLANQILGVGSLGRLFQNIREDKGYTYGAYSDYSSDRIVGEFSASASVRNEVTDSAIVEFMTEFERIRTEPVSDEELQGAKNFIIGGFGRSLERPMTIAGFALDVERHNLPKDYYESYLTTLGSLTKEDIMAVAQKYIKPSNMTITVVGKANEVADKLEKFGKIQYYDEEGNKTEKPSMPVPEGVTAQMVLDNYIKAIGGADNLNKVKSIAMNMEAEIAGAPMSLKAVSYKKDNNKYKFTLSADGMGTIQEQIYNDGKAKESGMQGARNIEGDELKAMEADALIAKELKYAEMGYKLELTSMAMIDGEKAFVMKITDPAGEASNEYYSEASGLKLKEDKTEDTPQGPMTTSIAYGDYRDVKGVKYAHSQVIMAGPQKIKMTVTDITVNGKIDNSEFAIK
jgi:predicted Zn-dependent peptidase